MISADLVERVTVVGLVLIGLGLAWVFAHAYAARRDRRRAALRRHSELRSWIITLPPTDRSPDQS